MSRGRLRQRIGRALDPWTRWVRDIPYRNGVLYTLKAALAAGTAVTAVLVFRSPWWFFGVIPCAVFAVVVEAIQARLSAIKLSETADAEITVRKDFAELINGALVPIGAYLGNLSPTEQDEQRLAAFGTLRQKVVDAVVEIVNAADRSSYYEAEPDGRLVRKAFNSRTTEPRQEFAAGSPDYDEMMKTINDRDAVYVPDVCVDKKVQPTPGSGYRSVIRVAVSAHHRGSAVLTVDSPTVDAFTQWEINTLKALASLLGAGLAWVSRPAGGA